MSKFDYPEDDRELDAYADRRLTRDCLRCGRDVIFGADEPYVLHVYCDMCADALRTACHCGVCGWAGSWSASQVHQQLTGHRLHADVREAS